MFFELATKIVVSVIKVINIAVLNANKLMVINNTSNLPQTAPSWYTIGFFCTLNDIKTAEITYVNISH